MILYIGLLCIFFKSKLINHIKIYLTDDPAYKRKFSNQEFCLNTRFGTEVHAELYSFHRTELFCLFLEIFEKS